jgi:hypothetical protein
MDCNFKLKKFDKYETAFLAYNVDELMRNLSLSQTFERSQKIAGHRAAIMVIYNGDFAKYQRQARNEINALMRDK